MESTFEQKREETQILSHQQVRCPKCDTSIPLITLNIQGNVVFCPTCSAAIRLIDRIKFPLLKYPPETIPKGINFEVNGERLTFIDQRSVWSFRSFIATLMIFSIIFGVGAFYLWGTGLFFLPCVWLVLGVLFFVLNRSTTTIEVTPAQVTIKRPSNLNQPTQIIGAEEVVQLYVTQQRQEFEDKVLEHFTVWLQRTEYRPGVAVIWGINDGEFACFLEQEIERFLGLEDKIVEGQYRGESNQSHLQSWEQFARDNRLNFVKGKILAGSRVWGLYQNANLELIANYIDRNRTMHTTRMSLTAQASFIASNNVSIDNVQKAFAKEGVVNIAPYQMTRLDYEKRQIVWEQQALVGEYQILDNALKTVRQWLQLTPEIIALEGEAMPVLIDVATANSYKHPFRDYAWTLITVIAPATQRWQDRLDRLLCQRCLTRPTTYKTEVSLNRVIYCGCRICHQSKDFYEADQVVAALDQELSDHIQETDQILRVNWLTHLELFDFNTVEILDATDEEVERFAVQIGNDTDPLRKSRYGSMTCRVSTDLNPNTLRILERTFGQIVIINNENFTVNN